MAGVADRLSTHSDLVGLGERAYQILIERSPIPEKKHLAVVFGFKQVTDAETELFAPDPKRGWTRKALVERLVTPLLFDSCPRVHPVEQQRNLSEFYARYLPEMILSCLYPPVDPADDKGRGFNAFELFLVKALVHENAYIFKFMYSAKQWELQKGLISAVASAIVRVADHMERRFQQIPGLTPQQMWKHLETAHMFTALDALLLLLRRRRDDAIRKEPIPSEIKGLLLSQLESWESRWPFELGGFAGPGEWLNNVHELYDLADSTRDLDSAYVLFEFVELISALRLDKGWFNTTYSEVAESDIEALDPRRKCKKCLAERMPKLWWCGRCKTVKYCSRACQKADWDDPDLPHRDFCYRITY